MEEDNNIIFITVFKKGFSLHHFDPILKENPQVAITKFLVLKDALQMATNERLEIGESRPLIDLIVSKDEMTATIHLNCTENFLESHDVSGNVLQMLHENNIKEGILIDVLQNQLVVNKDIVIAKGTEPIHGEDAKITYFKLSERKPTIGQDGKADYYDMNFIDTVSKGDWLGERIPPTNGIPGKTIRGNIIVPRRGKERKLLYDRKTVGEFEENGRTVLRAFIDGVVTFVGGRICVDDHLQISGDVGIETGNIDFDGSVTVTGVIQPGFSVTATKDISILGEWGVSGIKGITSKDGDVFIKGGIFGQGMSKVQAEKNIFVKHANNCILVAKEDIHIGYYAIGSSLEGRNIIADEKRGKLIGGKIKAIGKISAAVIGNKMELKTIIEVEGFDRQKLKEELEEILLQYKKEVIANKTIAIQLEAFENSSMNQQQKIRYEALQSEMDEKLLKIANYDARSKYIMYLLEMETDGEVLIHEVAYPNTTIKIKNDSRKLMGMVKGSFYAEGKSVAFK